MNNLEKLKRELKKNEFDFTVYTVHETLPDTYRYFISIRLLEYLYIDIYNHPHWDSDGKLYENFDLCFNHGSIKQIADKKQLFAVLQFFKNNDFSEYRY